ncbi:MAG: 2,3-cyclic 3-phosphodiesterase [Thermodesulfobacteriota bacterium]|nr:2,3-cyclic 3-phosphodiesterase [Thermodesulfobacteriota bacterium]
MQRSQDLTMRAFIALRLPENILSSINKIQEDLKRYRLPVRWVRPGHIHLTLKFFGDISESDIKNIKIAIDACAGNCPPVTLSAKGIGVFQSVSRPRVIWVGLSGQVPMLSTLQDALEKMLEKSGFKKEERPFKGHLTIGRFKERVNSEKLIEAMRTHKDFNTDIFEAGEIILFKSDLLPAGPVYTELLKVPLTAS